MSDYAEILVTTPNAYYRRHLHKWIHSYSLSLQTEIDDIIPVAYTTPVVSYMYAEELLASLWTP